MNRLPAMWYSEAEFPLANGLEWIIWQRGVTIICRTPADVLAKLNAWHPYHKVLVAAPGGTNFLPPICHPQLRAELMSRLKRRAMQMLTFLHVVMLLLLFVSIHAESRNIQLATMLLGVTLLAHWSDYFFLGSAQNVYERAAFFYQLSSTRSYRRSLMASVIACSAAGILQLLLTDRLGDLDLLVRAFGAYLPAIGDGEYWRVLIGPFFHSGLIHWLQNALMCALIIPTLSSLLGAVPTLVVFILGNAVGVISVMRFASDYDAYVGVSAGTHALGALLLVFLIASRRHFPAGLWVILGSLILTDYLIAAMNPAASITAHLFGEITGILLGIALLPMFNARQQRLLRIR